SSDVTYTSSSSGLTATAFAPLNCAPVVQPLSAPATTQSVPSVACVRAPVEGSRENATRALETAVATYTLAPPPLTAMPSGAPRARPGAQAVGATSAQATRV